MAGYKDQKIRCSVVVPLYNEAEAVEELYQRLKAALDGTAVGYELIFIDDGSTDRTPALIRSLADTDSTLTVVILRRNFGQTPALAAGFDIARGDIVISMDGDLQHSPEEIPRFIDKMKEGYDVVSGWRKERVDDFLTRKVPSRIANSLIRKISGVEIHDFGTTFKAYRRQVLKEVSLYGEMHRFIPALLSVRGVRIAEIPIKNIARPKGHSSYDLTRTFRVAFDLITLRFMLGYLARPLHFFGRAAWYCIFLAALSAFYMLYDKFAYSVPIFTAHGPLALAAGVLLLVGLGFGATGLIGEMISRLYFEATQKKPYSIREVHRSDEREEIRYEDP